MLSIRYGEELIEFERLIRTHGNGNDEANGKIQIKVHADCRVTVLAPEQAANEAVIQAVKKRSRWIYQQLRDFKQQKEYELPRQYVSGESHYYLGKQYLLKVLESNEQPQGVKMLRGKLEVTLRGKTSSTAPVKTQELLQGWYKTRAQIVFQQRLEAMLPQCLWVSTVPDLQLRIMQTQWGSCSPQGRIILNPNLVKAPRDCIDYVILHELCHLAEHNHSERFYRLLGQVMPNWEEIKTRLDNMAGKLLG